MKRQGIREIEPGEDSVEARSYVDVARAHPSATTIRRLSPFRDLSGMGWGAVFAYRMSAPHDERTSAAKPRNNRAALARAALHIELANQESVVETIFKITDVIDIERT